MMTQISYDNSVKSFNTWLKELWLENPIVKTDGSIPLMKMGWLFGKSIRHNWPIIVDRRLDVQ